MKRALADAIAPTESWSTQQLTEFLALVSSRLDVDGAMHCGVKRAAETLPAQAAALVRRGKVACSFGFPDGAVPVCELESAAVGECEKLELAGGGPYRVTGAAVEEDDGMLLVVHREAELTPEQSNLLQGMARILGLSLRTLRLLSDERSLRARSEQQAEENARLLGALTERQTLLERTSKIQRSIVDRAQLSEVLESIVAGTAELLRAPWVALRLMDGDDPEAVTLAAHRGRDLEGIDPERATTTAGIGGRAIRERRLVRSAGDGDARPGRRGCGATAVMAAPVWENGQIVGSLTAAASLPGHVFSHAEEEVLLAFTEHASLALTDAKNFDAAVHRAFHDMLTGLPNRALFLDRLEQAIRRGERTNSITAVLFLDLDGFKRVNDSLGHAAGDEMLIEVAARLEDCLRPADTAARFGGDEFAVLLENLARGSDATMVASRIMASLQEPVMLHGRRVSVSASIGVALHREPGDDLMRNADLAMYRAKSRGKSRYEVFDPAMHTVVMERLRLEAELQRAVEQEEFTLQFQPIVRLANGGIAGVEALIRWQHPERGMIFPNDFIPVAEETRLISPIGRWVLNEACRQGVRWQALHPSAAPLIVSVNLSVTQLQQPGLIYEVAEALERSGLDPACLILEITETLLMDNVELMADTLDGLKRLGVQLAVDDFGTGYSSLQYLRRFPIDILKIAKPFVDEIDAGESTLARVILDLGGSLGLEVIAEGIEHLDQAKALQQMGCTWGQGYHYARPMDRDAVDRLLAQADAIEGWGRNLPASNDASEGGNGRPPASASATSVSTPPRRRQRPRQHAAAGLRLVEDWPGAASSSGRAPDF